MEFVMTNRTQRLIASLFAHPREMRWIAIFSSPYKYPVNALFLYYFMRRPFSIVETSTQSRATQRSGEKQ